MKVLLSGCCSCSPIHVAYGGIIPPLSVPQRPPTDVSESWHSNICHQRHSWRWVASQFWRWVSVDLQQKHFPTMATSRRDLMSFEDNVPFSTAVMLNLPQLQGCCVIQAHIYCLLPAVLVGLHKDRVLRKLLQQSQSSGRLAVVATNITLGDTGELSPRSFRDNRHFSNDICGILFSLYQIGVSQT